MNARPEAITVEIATFSCGCRCMTRYTHIPRWADAAVDGALNRCEEWQAQMKKALRYRTYSAFSTWSEKHCPKPAQRIDVLEVLRPMTLEDLDALFAGS